MSEWTLCPKNKYFFTFFWKMAKCCPNFDFVFREISRNSKEISRNSKLKISRNYENENFAKLRKWNFSQPPYPCPAPNIPFELWRIFCRFCHDHTVQVTFNTSHADFFSSSVTLLHGLVTLVVSKSGHSWLYLFEANFLWVEVTKNILRLVVPKSVEPGSIWLHLPVKANWFFSSPRSSDLLNTSGLFKT